MSGFLPSRNVRFPRSIGHREEALGWVEAIGLERVEPWLRPALDLYAVSISRERPAEAIDWGGEFKSESFGFMDDCVYYKELRS